MRQDAPTGCASRHSIQKQELLLPCRCLCLLLEAQARPSTAGNQTFHYTLSAVLQGVKGQHWLLRSGCSPASGAAAQTALAAMQRRPLASEWRTAETWSLPSARLLSAHEISHSDHAAFRGNALTWLTGHQHCSLLSPLRLRHSLGHNSDKPSASMSPAKVRSGQCIAAQDRLQAS